MTSIINTSGETGQHGDAIPSAKKASPGDAVTPAGDNRNIPKPKRLACLLCRKRKLRCDGVKPCCSTCSRLNHPCAYDEVRRKSGPKRGYVKALEERLKQVETLLETREPVTATRSSRVGRQPTSASGIAMNATVPCIQTPVTAAAADAGPKFNMMNPSIQITTDRDAMDQWQVNTSGESPQPEDLENFNFNTNMVPDLSLQPNNPAYEIMQLGLQEPLPPREMMDDLHHVYFEKIAPTCPIIHQLRYLAAMNLAPMLRPPPCLRYAMWALASGVMDEYHHHQGIFYERARMYLETDYIKGHGEHLISLAHAQTHILLGKYELKTMYFPRAWMSVGSGIRLCQMMGLHRLDGSDLDVKQCCPPPKDWTESEERRRTFWMAFCLDRYASMATGWPMTVDERDIFTNLPASDVAFEMSRPETTQPLGDAMSPSGATKLSSFGGMVLTACLFGRNFLHLHRPDQKKRNDDLNGEFWIRHRHIDNMLLNTSLCLPQNLKLPTGIQDPKVVFTNMCIHTSTICLHQAAIFTADKYSLPGAISGESKMRCIAAANEIASAMRMTSHMDLSTLHPFTTFSLYIAAGVLIQFLKSFPDDSKMIDSLRFILSAMNALKRRNPATESFLVQLDVDLEALGMKIPKLKELFPRNGDVTKLRDGFPRGACKKQSSKDSGEGGISVCRNECNFMKIADNDGNPATAPKVVPHSESSRPSRQKQPESCVPSTSTATSFYSGHTWSPGDQQELPKRERGNIGCGGSGNGETLQQQIAGIMMQPTHHVNLLDKSNTSTSGGATSDSNDLSVSPEADLSNRPTPNSSTVSDQFLGCNCAGNLAAGPINASGSSSFSPSPTAASQPSNMTPEEGTGVFSTTSFPLRHTGMTLNQRFSVPDIQTASWQMPAEAETAATPVAQGVLRDLMNMNSLEMMDMSWEPGAS